MSKNSKFWEGILQFLKEVRAVVPETELETSYKSYGIR
jgi:hypothetical protein